MRRLLFHLGHARPVLIYPIAAIVGVLAALTWYMVIVGVILPVIAGTGGPD